MRARTCSAPLLLLLLLLSACATMDPSPGELEDPSPQSPRFANLQRAAQYPWTDDGKCVVREASNEWPSLAERCFMLLIATGSGSGMSPKDALSPTRMQPLPQSWPSVFSRHPRSSSVQ
jgi:hypothetical protein